MNSPGPSITLSPASAASAAAITTDDNVANLSLGTSISIAILLLITTITLMVYFCPRAGAATITASDQVRRHEFAEGGHDYVLDLEAGFDEAMLKSWPKVSYSAAKHRDPRAGGAGCSVCLTDYADEDVLRVLQECGHMFHVRCVDPWLRMHRTCPVCRATPVPSRRLR
ncbi:putative RING-H2 finger protein ATL71 [Platanthera guangdongensis]|uniref:RING-H2 finger protein ATL71 n=1 Tax=Platanthera guangdongensis TaxID=2320717 RepID=A0ABR2N4Y5_9ASPA